MFLMIVYCCLPGKGGEHSVGSSMSSLPGYNDHHDGYSASNGYGHSWSVATHLCTLVLGLGTGFASRYRLQPRGFLIGPMGRCKALSPPNL